MTRMNWAHYSSDAVRSLFDVSTDQVIGDLGRAEDAGQPGARVGTGADEVEIGDVFRLIVRPKIGGLGQNRLDGEGGAEVAVEFVAEVARVDHALGNDVLRQVRQEALFQVGHDAVSVGTGGPAPIDISPQVRHWSQD